MITIEHAMKSQFSLDVEADCLLIRNNLTKEIINVPLQTYNLGPEGNISVKAMWSGGLYYGYMGDFNNIKPGEYSYEAYKDNKLVQVGLIQIEMPNGKDPDPNVENSGQLRDIYVSQTPEVITYKP